MSTTTPLLKLRNLVKHFDISGGFLEKIQFENMRPVLKHTIVKAVNDVSFDIHKGETVSVVGESGCGKSTLARAVIGIHKPESGEIFFKGDRIDNLSHKKMLPYRSKMQMIFQDPYSSLNPRKTVKQTLMEPIKFHNNSLCTSEIEDKIADVMKQVGVDPAWAARYPHEFSGGQRQRVSIARALAVDPEFIVADEPISALDVSVQAQILNLLMKAGEERGLSYLFISHDLSVVKHISTRVVVMYLGTVCEIAPADALYTEPRHPYTQALLSAIPSLSGRKKHVKLKGEVPSPIDLPCGCVFNARCNYAVERCSIEKPELHLLENGVKVACHRVGEGLF